MTPEELVPLLLTDFIPAAKRNLDSTSAKHLAETAKLAGDLGRHFLREQCLNRVEAILADMVPVTP